MAIFGRNTARQRLRRATRESLTIPAFSSRIDCTPWVTGGLWPAELSTINAENAAVAKYLKIDLQKITSSANDELEVIRRAGMSDPARQAEEARVIDDARARATQHVESAVGRLRAAAAQKAAKKQAASSRPNQAQRFAGTDPQVTRVLPAVEAPEPGEADERAVSRARHRAPDDDSAGGAREPGPAEVTAVLDMPEPESDSERLRRLLAFVVRQEPGLSWAVGDRPDGTTALVTDLAHGWVPPGVALPAGVRLLEPERRSVKIRGLIGDTTRAAFYSPGDTLGRPDDFGATPSSTRPRQAPAVEDLGWVLGEATRWREGLPRIVHTLARAAAAGTGVVDEELDLLRVHLDTARYQLLGQYPSVDPALLLNCLLLAATEGIATGEPTVANYHMAWFQKLSAPPPSQWSAKRPS